MVRIYSCHRMLSRFVSFILFPVAGSLLAVLPVYAEIYPAVGDMVGSMKEYLVQEDESLLEIARWHHIGYNAITAANQELDPYLPGKGSRVRIPARRILPALRSRESVVINVAEMRLYYFFSIKKTPMVATYAVGIGEDGKDTPLGTFRIVRKAVRPPWVVPHSARTEDPMLPRIVPPGGDNPLGSHALGLSVPGILIHGTNKPWGIGRRSTHGCIRLYPEDIPNLYRMVNKGTRVVITREHVKVGVAAGRVYVEVHEGVDVPYQIEAIRLLAEQSLLGRIDFQKLGMALLERSGIPTDISQ